MSDQEFVQCDACRDKPGMLALCDGCLHNQAVIARLSREVIEVLKNSGIDTTCEACMEVAYTGITTSAHTCKQAEGPLLQCVDCGNTESPAGAMARRFNHGRCLRCGSYFKVVRA